MRLAGALAVAVLVCAGTATAATPVGVVREIMEAAPGKMPGELRCISRQELLRKARPMLRAAGRTVHAGLSGLTFVRAGHMVVLLDGNRVCRPLYRYVTQGGVPFGTIVDALAAVLHEKAHAQGIRTEWKASCWAIRPTLSQGRRWGWTAKELSEVKHYLAFYLDGWVPEEYKLYGRCRV